MTHEKTAEIAEMWKALAVNFLVNMEVDLNRLSASQLQHKLETIRVMLQSSLRIVAREEGREGQDGAEAV